MKEYIFGIEEDNIDETEVFYGWIRKHSPELIRCKDCKWFVHDDDCYGDCSNEGGAKDFVYTNDFCSRAEKKENAEKNDSNSVNNNDHSVCDN